MKYVQFAMGLHILVLRRVKFILRSSTRLQILGCLGLCSSLFDDLSKVEKALRLQKFGSPTTFGIECAFKDRLEFPNLLWLMQ